MRIEAFVGKRGRLPSRREDGKSPIVLFNGPQRPLLLDRKKIFADRSLTPGPRREEPSRRRPDEPGIVVLDEAGRLCYLNERGKSFMALFRREETRGGRKSRSLPSVFLEFIRAFQEGRRSAILQKGASGSRVRCRAGNRYALRAVPLGYENSSGRRYLMILIERARDQASRRSSDLWKNLPLFFKE